MAVYVDKIKSHPSVKGRAKRWGSKWCHMTADSIAELVAFARELGLKDAYFQTSRNGIHHYDMTPIKRIKAIQLGAVEITTRDMLKRVVDNGDT